MSRSSSSLSKNSDFVNQILEGVITAISEHKWNDASYLLPAAVALSRRKISPYFIWQIVYALMSSTNIPLAVQIQILQVTQKSSVKIYELILDMLAYKFEAIPDDDFEIFYESINESQKSRESKNLLRTMCFAYYALHHYLKWKRLLLISQKPNMCESKLKLTDEELRKQLGKQGFKVHSLLSKTYSLLQLTDSAPANSKKGEQQQQQQPIPCEWLLGPLLDVETCMKVENFSKALGRNVKTNFDGLALVENYVKIHPDHIPGLRTFYFYLITYHSEEKTLIFDVLEKIVQFSPDSSLVLQYVFSLLSKEEIEIISSKERNKKRKKNCCRIGSININTIFKCLKLLANFIEYRMWRKDVRAWKALKDLLVIFHESWISCWECHHCVSSRNQMENFSDTLSSWSNFIWHETQLKLFNQEDADLLVYMGYTSFILGYNERIAKNSIECLEKLNCCNEATNLLKLMRLKGNHMRDFLIYLTYQRKRHITEDQDSREVELESSSFRKIEVKFSTFKIRRKNYFASTSQSCSTTENECFDGLPSNSNSSFGIYRNEYVPEELLCESGNENHKNINSNPNIMSEKCGSKIAFGRKIKIKDTIERNEDCCTTTQVNVEINNFKKYDRQCDIEATDNSISKLSITDNNSDIGEGFSETSANETDDNTNTSKKKLENSSKIFRASFSKLATDSVKCIPKFGRKSDYEPYKNGTEQEFLFETTKRKLTGEEDLLQKHKKEKKKKKSIISNKVLFKALKYILLL